METLHSKPIDWPPLGDVVLDDANLLSAAQLVFAEKRTDLSLMRTGISVMALPLAVVSALIVKLKRTHPAMTPFFD